MVLIFPLKLDKHLSYNIGLKILPNMSSHIKALISDHKFNDALALLLDHCRSSEFENRVIGFGARYKSSVRNEQNGTLPAKEFTQELNKLVHQMIEFIDEVEEILGEIPDINIDHIQAHEEKDRLTMGLGDAPPGEKEGRFSIDLDKTADIEELAKKKITQSCLIAADIDKTYIEQSDDDEQDRIDFTRDIAPSIVKAAQEGTNLAVITGNSMNSLTDRFVRWTIQQLCLLDALGAIGQFYFFCNSGGVFVHIPSNHPQLANLSPKQRQDPEVILGRLADLQNGKWTFRPEFINASYIERTRIPHQDELIIQSILDGIKDEYVQDLRKGLDSYREQYHINSPEGNVISEGGEKPMEVYPLFGDQGQEVLPQVSSRSVVYRTTDSKDRNATVQITLKPVLSFRHAKHPKEQFGKDLRTRYLSKLQRMLDECGLGQYVARPGGRSSIDVTLEKLDKAYALEFLIDHLNLQGSERKGLKFGSNAIYLGDEIIVGGGNDYPVTRIPGLLVLAVNSDKKLIPMLSKVIVPNAIETGPSAAKEFLEKYNNISRRLVKEYVRHERKEKHHGIVKNAVHAFKEDFFINRINEKLKYIEASLQGQTNEVFHPPMVSVDDLQTLHAFITMVSRQDEAASKWISILMNELDSIMAYLSSDEGYDAYGGSHEDG